MTDLGMGRGNLHRFLALTLFVLLMASASVEAQSAATPSDELSSSQGAEEAQPREAPPRVASDRTGSKTSAEAQRTLRLCFFPGIGWQSVDVPAVGETEMRKSTAGSVWASAHSRRAGGGEASDKGCPGSFANAAAQGLSTGSRAKPTASIGLGTVNTGMNDSFIANPVINPANGSAYERSVLGVSSMLAGSANKSTSAIVSRRNILSLSSTPTASANILGAEPNSIKFKAYASSADLRRMIRNAPDLETRLKLRRVRRRLEESKRRSSTDSSEALNSTLGKFSFRSNSETSRLRVERKTPGARRTATSQPLRSNSSFTAHARANP
jgi:hypothetical protein